MIQQVEAFIIKCDECGDWINTSRRRPKLFQCAFDAKVDAIKKGWKTKDNKWFCPRCDKYNRVVPYVYPSGGRRDVKG